MADMISVVDWVSSDENESRPCSIGGLGGWFGFDVRNPGGPVPPHDWAEYVRRTPESERPYAEALRSAIVAGRIRHGGFWHQSENADGTPVFSDGTVGAFTMRAWGDLLAAIWTEHDRRPYTYVDFAWTDDETEAA